MDISENTKKRIMEMMKEAARQTFREEISAQRGYTKDQIDITIPGQDGTKQYPQNLLGRTLQLAYKAQMRGDSNAASELSRLGVVKAMQEDTDSEGGFLVPTDYIAQILKIWNLGNLEPLCRKVPMGSKTVTFPDLNSSVSCGWTAEEGTLTETTPVLGQITLTAKKVGAFTTISNELLSDARPDVVSFLENLMIEAMGREIDNQILNGNGSPCSGLLTAACGTSVVMGAGLVNFSSISGSNLSEMTTKISTGSLNGARFVMHPKVFHYVRTLKDNNNQFIYSPIGGGQNGTIWGYPVTLCDSAPSTSGAGTAFVLFGNFDYFLIGERQSLSVSIDPYGLFTSDQTRVRWTRRLAPQIGRADAFCRLLTAAT